MQTPPSVGTLATQHSWSAEGSGLARPNQAALHTDEPRVSRERDDEPRVSREVPTRSWARSWRRTYPLLGVLLALGSVTGLLLVRMVYEGRPLSASAIRADLASDPLTYAYIVLSSLVTFVLLGWVLGRKQDKLQAASATDPLTGLWNRRHLHARLSEEVGRAARYGDRLALLMIDLDRLKAINDKGGHTAGDAALRRVARCLRQTCRSTDIAARYGGDEFIVLAPGSDAAQAMELAERIVKAVRRDAPSSPISVSVGVSDIELAGAISEEALCESADRALYAAKSLGRNRAALAERPAA